MVCQRVDMSQQFALFSFCLPTHVLTRAVPLTNRAAFEKGARSDGLDQVFSLEGGFAGQKDELVVKKAI